MNLNEWRSIQWQTRNEIKERYGSKPSGQVKTISVGYGRDVVEDDGVKESDLAPIATLTVAQVLAPEVVIVNVDTQPAVAAVEEIKVGKAKKTKKTK